MTLRQLTWMERGREEAVWDVAKWILASIQKSWSADAKDIPFRPEKWDIPDTTRLEQAKLIEEKRRELEEKKRMEDPAYVEELRAKRLAQFNAFRSQLRSR